MQERRAGEIGGNIEASVRWGGGVDAALGRGRERKNGAQPTTTKEAPRAVHACYCMHFGIAMLVRMEWVEKRVV